MNTRYPGITFAETFGPEVRAEMPCIDEAENIARAVLTAIREPSEGMIEAAGFVQQRTDDENPGYQTWRDMIDAALSEGG